MVNCKTLYNFHLSSVFYSVCNAAIKRGHNDACINSAKHKQLRICSRCKDTKKSSFHQQFTVFFLIPKHRFMQETYIISNRILLVRILFLPLHQNSIAEFGI
jgi:hypothetical protein